MARDVLTNIEDAWFSQTPQVSPFPQDQPSHGQTFGTTNGNLSFDEFGEIVSEMWNSAHVTTKMYRMGSPDVDDTKYPVILWKCGGSAPTERTPLKPKSIESFRGEDGKTRQVFLFEFMSAFSVEIISTDARESAQVARQFIKFMLEFVGVLMQLGIGTITFNRRYRDRKDDRAGRQVTIIELEYNVIEQCISVVEKRTIEQVQMMLKTITENMRT